MSNNGRQPAQRAIVFIDADNTLWDTNEIFANAQLHLLTNVEGTTGQKCRSADRLSFVREIDQALASLHHSGLRYPPKLLATGVALALTGESPEHAAQRAWRVVDLKLPVKFNAETIEHQFMHDLSAKPTLRAGVQLGLHMLHEKKCVTIVLTEGNRDRVELLLQHYGVRKDITRVIEAKKTPILYARVSRLFERSIPKFMIGDQLDRDVGPAKAAGVVAVYFPGGFQPKWRRDDQDSLPDLTVRTFDEAARYVLDLSER